LVPQPATGRLRPAKILTLLFQSLLEPVLDTLLRSRTTYIIPTGALHYIPLAALSPKVGEPPPLLAADRRVVYAPSATILLQHGGGHSMPNGRTSLAVAPGASDLRFVEESALAIASSTTGKSLVGSEATRSQFIKEAIHARHLYFLGHAYFNGRYPMSSRLQLSDGPLSASEMLQTLCLEADLVVLASCESGRSAIPRGDEIMGLVRAFLYAGARSLLVTLWPVHEVPTRLLVERLVQTLQVMEQAGRKSDPAQALAEAQNWLRGLTVSDVHRLVSKWTVSTSVEMTSLLTELWRMTHSEKEPIPGDRLFSHPFFWSAFILIGETPVDPDLS
ncbi:MAG: CHAT domain-containing protein, partial [Caldilineaceae bacterium]|nr:CHAT domain-containing protein [Caldilineaceae bacterium]